MFFNSLNYSLTKRAKLMALMAEFMLSQVIDEASFTAQKKNGKVTTTLRADDLMMALKKLNIPCPQMPSNNM